MRFSVLMLILGYAFASCESAQASWITDGSFENQAVLQNNPYTTQPDGEKWGAGWGGSNWGWSSWQYNFSVSGAWIGGAIARTEDFAAGWKWARTGDVFGIIKDRQTMSQTFQPTTSGKGLLTWHDANRASWRELDWFGRPNDYSVTLTDSLNNVQNLGNFTSKVFGGNSYSNPVADGWWTQAGKTGWEARSVSNFDLVAGMTYTLKFNSLSPYYNDKDGVQQVDDRTTFLDDISLTALDISQVPEPSTLAIFGLGSLGLAFLRRRRTSLS